MKAHDEFSGIADSEQDLTPPKRQDGERRRTRQFRKPGEWEEIKPNAIKGWVCKGERRQ
jgi:hypothetical protein